MTFGGRLAIVFLLIITAVLSLRLWEETSRVDASERRRGDDVSRTITAVFVSKNQLRVGAVEGWVSTQSESDGLIFHPTQITKAPYAVSYFIELDGIRRGSYDWDPNRKLITVRIPNVVTDKPNIDMQRALVSQKGIWVSRKASIELNRQASQRLSRQAVLEAQKEAHLRVARSNAEKVIQSFLAPPLAAAGFGDVEVAVRFPWEGEHVPERMERSRSLKEVLGFGK